MFRLHGLTLHDHIFRNNGHLKMELSILLFAFDYVAHAKIQEQKILIRIKINFLFQAEIVPQEVFCFFDKTKRISR